MKLFFVRHGQTPFASEHRLSGDNEGLSPAGVDEARRAAEKLKNELGGVGLDMIISSPRKRTLETAHTIATTLGFDSTNILHDERLIERDCTPYLGWLISDVFSKSEEELIASGMESLDSLYARSKDFYDELMTKDENSAVLLVGHSGNLAPLFYAARGLAFGAKTDVPDLALDDVLRLK